MTVSSQGQLGVAFGFVLVDLKEYVSVSSNFLLRVFLFFVPGSVRRRF